jgi:hypothetical protein
VTDDPHSPTTAAPIPPGQPGAVAPSDALTAEHPAVAAPPPGHEQPSAVASAAQTASAKAASARESAASAAASANRATADHPEILAGAAFAGGLVVAMILKRLTR